MADRSSLIKYQKSGFLRLFERGYRLTAGNGWKVVEELGYPKSIGLRGILSVLGRFGVIRLEGLVQRFLPSNRRNWAK